MTQVDRLQTLFRAFRERDDKLFNRAAESIIADELAANHHAAARELRSALQPPDSISRSRNSSSMNTLPRDKRNGEPLLLIAEPFCNIACPLLTPDADRKVERVILEYSNRQKLADHGYKPKTKLLLWGPPGCGKTLTAHWIAQCLALPVGTVRLSNLITSFLGETTSHLQRVFEVAANTPMVLLLDEVDAIAKERGDTQDVGELKRIVNGLLQALDFHQSSKSILISATNHQLLLDDALWRRFDEIIEFPLPTNDQVKQFLASLLNGVKIDGSVANLHQSANALSFAQIERVTIDVVKTMILEDRKTIRATELSAAFKSYKASLASARKQVCSKSKPHEQRFSPHPPKGT